MDNFPERVTLYDDGAYRWHYDMDMWHNRYMIRLIVKILSLLLGIPTLFIAAMLLKSALPMLQNGVSQERLAFFLNDDLLALYIVGGLWLGMLVLAELIYAICALAMKGVYRLYFQMDESAVALVRRPGTMEALNTLGLLVGVAGLVAGKPGEALRAGSTLAVANSSGVSRFENARRLKTVEKYDLLDLREFFGMNQIYVPKEDYEAVRDFMLERMPEKARMRSEK